MIWGAWAGEITLILEESADVGVVNRSTWTPPVVTGSGGRTIAAFFNPEDEDAWKSKP